VKKSTASQKVLGIMTENETKSQIAIETLPNQGLDKADGEPLSSKDNDKITSAQSIEKHKEYGGRKGLNPTRYGDWERNGRCVDF